MNILIDSSLFIEHLRTFIPGKSTRLTYFVNQNYNIYFSIISVGEIYSGKSAPSDEKEINSIFDMSSIIDINYELMKSAAVIRRTTHISLIDAVIAATALELHLPIATLNVKDFKKVKGVRIFKEMD